MGWKDAPADPSKRVINRSMELQVLLSCNWRCVACDQHSQFSSIAWVRKATMTLEQIASFCDEMQNANAYLGRIRILGGEPTLHPKLDQIVKALHARLVLPGHLGAIEIITNGTHPEKIEPVKHLLSRVRVSGEADKERNHVANMAATPDSLGYAGKMCNSPWHCGFSLNYYGYFPCSAGAGIARFRDWMDKWQRLKLPVDGVMKTWPDLQELCNFCYHGLKAEDKVKCGTDKYELNTPNADNWSHLAGWLLGKQPTFKVYGETEPCATV